MNYLQALENYIPANEQEAADKQGILQHCALMGDKILTRESRLAHLCSSGLILNQERNKVLFCHHNILGVWAWTGGHMDGDTDPLYVAVKEAKEETGASVIRPISNELAGVDILHVPGHIKHGAYVNVHLHLTFSYLLECPEDAELSACPGENTGVEWFPLDWITTEHLPADDVYLYKKLLERVKAL